MFVIGPDKRIKLILTYPMTTGRNFDELLRVVDSLQLTARHRVATPANWRPGEDVIIAGSVSNAEAETLFPNGWKSPKPYLRIVRQADGVWRLGDARREPVVLARSLMRLWAEPSIFDRVRVASAGIRVIAPRSDRVWGSPFASGIDWLPLEERFSFYGGRISFIPDPVRHRVEEPAPTDPTAPVFGPFSADFRWVTLPDWPHGPIRCTEGQAAVFEALWFFKGVEVHGERVMQRAGQSSEKPMDLFKVKTQYKGKPEHEGPLFAYRALVRSRRREGLYAMPCAGASGSD